MSFFEERCKTHIFSIGCRSPPSNLDFQKIQIGGNGLWLITKRNKNGNGGSGKKPRKRSCGAWVSMKIPLNSSAHTTGLSSIQTGGTAVSVHKLPVFADIIKIILIIASIRVLLAVYIAIHTNLKIIYFSSSLRPSSLHITCYP